MTPSSAMAFREPTPPPSSLNCVCHEEMNRLGGHASVRTQEWVDENCATCHTFNPDADADGVADFPFSGAFAGRGPHGAYGTGTRRCEMCHTLHDAPTGFKLLPGTTVKATCFTCHDGTGGQGAYGTIAARGLTVGGGHSVETTNAVPGGDAATGGTLAADFRGPGDTLTCSDCHSPHDSNTVDPFQGERIRIRTEEGAAPSGGSHLLKKRPTGAIADVSTYGSDWCMGCHAGRSSGGMANNHPVESTLTKASPYTYSSLAVYSIIFDTLNWTPSDTRWVQMGKIGSVSQGSSAHGLSGGPDLTNPWLMAVPRSALHTGHAPICQQCHEDSRECGDASSTPGWVSAYKDYVSTTNADGYTTPTHSYWSPNPRFQNFPHETQNASMLVEVGDDLCLNCHPPTALP